MNSADYLEQILKLLPPGSFFRALDMSGLFQGLADELAIAEERAVQGREEHDPRTAVETLDWWEEKFQLSPSSGTTAQRQARLVSHVLRLKRVRPRDYQKKLASVLGLPESQVEVIEVSRAQAIAANDDGMKLVFYIYRNPALGGDWDIVEAQKIIDKFSHSHTAGYAIESKAFIVDDPYSLVDRDIIDGRSPEQWDPWLFWDASEGVTLSVGKVSEWADQVSGARFSQATAANRPVVVELDPSLKLMDYLEFDSSDLLSLDTADVSLALQKFLHSGESDFEILIVYNYDDGIATRHLIATGDAGSTSFYIDLFADGTVEARIYNGASLALLCTSSAGSGWQLLRCRFTATAQMLELSLNGGPVASDSGATFSSANAAMTLTLMDQTNDPAKIAFVFVSKTLADDARQIEQNGYIQSRFGVAVT